jgi:hypothetical protein
LQRRPFKHRERDPDGHPRRARGVATLQKAVVGARQRIDAGRVLADEVRGDRQPFEVFGIERRLAFGLGEKSTCVGPRLTLEGVPAACQCPD